MALSKLGTEIVFDFVLRKGKGQSKNRGIPGIYEVVGILGKCYGSDRSQYLIRNFFLVEQLDSTDTSHIEQS